MKKLILSAAFIIAVTCGAFAQYDVKNIFRGYMNDEDVLAMSFGGEIINYIFPDSLEIGSTVDHLDFLLFDKSKDLSEREMSKLKKAISKDGYEPLISVKSNGANVRLMGIDNGDAVSAIYTRIDLGEKIAYLLFKGNMLYDDLQHIQPNNMGKLLGGFSKD